MKRFTPLLVLFTLASVSFAAPIRVGFFKGTGPARYWNPNMHTAGSALANILVNPDAANLGSGLVKPIRGISLSFYGLDSGTTGTPSPEQKNAFLNALDSLDVVIFSNSVGFGSIFTDTAQRQKLERFFKTRGVVSLHWTTQSPTGSSPYWGVWDSLPATLSSGWITENMGTLRRDTTANDPASRFLNRGLPDTARFHEKWLSFTRTPATLRATPGLKATMTLDSSSVAIGNPAMLPSNQPYSWYRTLPEGGRFFYTGLGHRIELFTGTATIDSAGDTTRPANNFLRRQLYNAILWAAGVDSNGVVSVRKSAHENASKLSNTARISHHGRMLTISVLQEGAHTVEITGLDGRRVSVRNGSGKREHTIVGLSSGVHMLVVTTPQGRHARRIVIP